MVELSLRVLRGPFVITGDVTLLHLQSVGNGIVTGHGIGRLGAEGVGLRLLHREALQNEQGDIERAEIHSVMIAQGRIEDKTRLGSHFASCPVPLTYPLRSVPLELSRSRPAVDEVQLVLPRTTEPHKKPQLRKVAQLVLESLVCPVLVAWQKIMSHKAAE